MEAESVIQRVFKDADLHPPHRPPATKLRVCMNEPYMALVGGLDWSEIGSQQGTSYASIVPWNNKKIGELLRLRGPGLNTSLQLDNADSVLLDRMQRLAFNVLLFLSQKPMVYKPEVIRPLRREGKGHIKAALHKAHFLGQEQFRTAATLLHGSGKAQEGPATGLQLKRHWRRGHWKRQPYGPKNSLRRWQWISIYHTFGPKENTL